MTQSTKYKSTGKAKLYCHECGHENRINGDWIIHVLIDSTTYECPECGTTINSRPNRKALTVGNRGSLRCVPDD